MAGKVGGKTSKSSGEAQVREGLPVKSRGAKKVNKPTAKANPPREGLPEKSRGATKSKKAAARPTREGLPEKSRGGGKKR